MSEKTEKTKLASYYAHYEKEYGSVIGLPELSKLLQSNGFTWLRAAADKFSFAKSSIWRHENMANLKYLIVPTKIDQICTAFKITRTSTTTYALLYSHIEEHSKSSKSPKSSKSSKSSKKRVVHDYVALSPTYKSADGEYRHRFVPVQQIVNHKKTYSELYDAVEKHLSDQVSDGSVVLEFTVIASDNVRKVLQKDIDKSGFALTFYASEWFVEYSRARRGRSENHIVSGYHEAMFDSEDSALWAEHKDFLERDYGKFYSKMTAISPNPNQVMLTTECGQKLVPLTVRDVEAADDIRLAPWREMYIVGRVGDLVINGITHGIPLLGDWFFVNLSGAMFDNEISSAKLKHSIVAEDIVRRLEAARRSTYLLDPINKKEIFLSYKMAGLSEAVDIPMNYAERDLVMSELVMCAVEEHLGRTVGDLPALMMQESYRADVGPMFSDYSHFARYCFEFVYTLYCMNKFLGVIHGDPHVNNITIYRVVSRLRDGKLVVNNPHMLYRVGDVLYLFPTVSRCAAFIDFSRGYLWKRDILLQDYSEAQIAQIRVDYQTRILETLAYLLPTYMESHRTDVELALDRHFDLVYQSFQVLDTYRLMMGLEHLFKQQVLGMPLHLKTYGDREMLTSMAFPLLATLRDEALNLFVSNLDLIIKAPKDKPPTLVEPNLVLLQRHFKEFVANSGPDPSAPTESADPITLVDYWSDQNELRYNIREYDKFPPTIKFDYVQKHGIQEEQMRMDSFYTAEAWKEDHNPETIVQEIAAAEQQRKQERRGTPTEPDDSVNAALAPFASTDDIYDST